MTDLAPAATAVATLAPVGIADPATRKRRLPQFGLLFGAAWLLLVLFLAVFADYLPFVRLPDRGVDGAGDYAFGPGADFWFGSDRNGRDVFARCVYGARISLIISVASIVGNGPPIPPFERPMSSAAAASVVKSWPDPNVMWPPRSGVGLR